jgi:hypothetical protein
MNATTTPMARATRPAIGTMTVWRSLPLAALIGFGTVASSAQMDPNGTVIGRIACNVVNGEGMHE